jgi:hypothetical protein
MWLNSRGTSSSHQYGVHTLAMLTRQAATAMIISGSAKQGCRAAGRPGTLNDLNMEYSVSEVLQLNTIAVPAMKPCNST